MIRFSRHGVSFIGAVALCLSLGGSALADPSSADVESAKVAYREGKELRDHGDLAGALGRFKAAFALVPTPITALEVGKTQVALGHFVDARDVLTSIERMPKKPDESEKAADARKEAAQLAQELQPKLASLTVNASPGETEPPIVSVDGADIPKDAAHTARVVDPGHHVVKVHSNSKSGQVEIDLKEGEQRSIDVPLTVDTPVAPTPQKTKLVPSPLVWAGFSVGALGVIVGGVTGVIALSKASTVKGECPNGQCPPSAHGDLNLTNAMSTTSTIAFIVGAVGVGVGVVGLFTSKREPAPEAVWLRRLRIGLGPGSISAGGTW